MLGHRCGLNQPAGRSHLRWPWGDVPSDKVLAEVAWMVAGDALIADKNLPSRSEHLFRRNSARVVLVYDRVQSDPRR